MILTRFVISSKSKENGQDPLLIKLKKKKKLSGSLDGLDVSKILESSDMTSEIQNIIKSLNIELEKTKNFEDLLNALLQEKKILVAFLDPKFDFIKVNEAYAKADEKEPSFFIGKNHFELYPNIENQTIFQKAVDTGEMFSIVDKPFVYANRPERGVTYWDWSLIPIKNSINVVTGLVLVIKNVSDRIRTKKMELKLKERTDILRERVIELNCLLNITKLLTLEKKPLKIVLPKVIEMIPLGWRYPDIDSIRIIFDEDEYTSKQFKKTKWMDSSDIFVSGKKRGTIELYYSREIILKDDDPFLIGEKELINAIARHIGDYVSLKDSEMDLHKSEEKFKSITELSQELIIRTTLDGRLTFINKSGAVFLGKKTEELVGANLFDYIHSGDIDKTRAIFIRFKEEKSHKMEFNTDLITPRGIRIIEWNALPIIDESEDVTEIQATGRDITELQEELIEKNKLAAVGTLAAGVAHELNTPLANIALIAEYLLNVLDDKKQIESKLLFDELKDIKKEIKSCTKIVTDLLQFSRRIHIVPSIINMKSLLIELINTPSIKTVLEEINVRIDLDIGEKLEIKGDRGLLHQVLLNIINNSFDSLENIKDPCIRISASDNDQFVKITIIDNGCGIKKENLPHIFEPFFSTKGVTKGTGLGLSISRGIIEKHGGTIKIDSEDQKGTEVVINLPK